jgi:ABC-type multidrug transport system ATPase subunit
MTDVERVAGRVVTIDEGRILLDSELDELREGYCLALVPHGDDNSRERVQAAEAYIGGRSRSEALHAIFHLAPENCQDYLERELGIAGARCAKISLEELFIDLVGEES